MKEKKIIIGVCVFLLIALLVYIALIQKSSTGPGSGTALNTHSREINSPININEDAKWQANLLTSGGFSIKYPPDWIKTETADTFSITKDGITFSISYKAYTSSAGKIETRDEVIANMISAKKETDKIMYVGGLPGREIGYHKTPNDLVIQVFVQKPGDKKIYIITLEPFNKSATRLSQILSEIQFAPSTPGN